MPRRSPPPATPPAASWPALLPLLLLPLLARVPPAPAEIAPAVGRAGAGGAEGGPLLNHFGPSRRCSGRRFAAILNAVDDVEDLELDVPVSIAMEGRQKKRFLLSLNFSTPLTIAFSQNVVRKVYFNQTSNLSRSLRPDQRTVLLPCALRGQYDVFLQARHRGSVRLEAHAGHPQAAWPLLNRTSDVGVGVRTQNRVRKRQMMVKWDKSKFDIHAVHYCLVISPRRAHRDFCAAVEEFVAGSARPGTCLAGSAMDSVWLRPPERARKIDPRITSVVCSGARTQQLLRGLAANASYHLDVFGVHTRRQNLTFHLASALVPFDRTHPTALRPEQLAVERLAGLHGAQVFGFKVPPAEAAGGEADGGRLQTLRYLVLPCGGSEVDVRVLRQRRTVGNVSGIYRPTYLRLPGVRAGERYLVRVAPSNEDEVLRASKVGLAVTTAARFALLPELPENITVFEVRSRCQSTTIAWYSAPEERPMSYCIIVFHLPHRNRSAADYTNYCMDFGRRFLLHPLFYSVVCTERSKSPAPLETQTVFNLSPGESYLVYVTAHLAGGRELPYQSLRVTMGHQCQPEPLDSREQTAFY